MAIFRWRLMWFVLGAGLFVGSIAVYSHQRLDRRRLDRERAATYETALQTYRQALPLGTTRQDVEAYLQKMGRPVRRMCCMDSSRSADERVLDLLTKVGVEPAPFYCSERNVYVGFEFAPSVPHPKVDGTASDRLTRIRLFHWTEGCW
jgi:hypothetical protein